MSNQPYKTKDLHEAGFLLASGLSFQLEEDRSGFSWFVFVDPSCKDLADSFWSGKSTINAKDFSNALYTLKQRLRSKV